MEKIITWTDDHEKVSDMAYINKLFKDMLYRSETATEAQEALHSLYTILMNNGLKRIRVCDAREDQYDESLLLKKGRMRALEFLKNPNLEASIAALKWYQIINKKENELMTIIKAKTIPTNLDADEEFEPVDGRKKIKTSTLRQDNLLEPSKEDPQCQLKNPGMDIEKSAGKVIVTDLIMLDQIPTSQSPEEMVLIQDKKSKYFDPLDFTLVNLPFVKSQASDTELQEGLSTKKFTNLIPQSSQMLTIPNIGSNSSTLLKNPSKEESREESQVPSMLDSLKISDDLSNVEILDKTALLKELEDLDILNEVLLLPASEFRHGTTLETGEIGITVDILSVPSESDSYKKEIQIQWVLLHEATYLKKFHCQTYHDNLKTNAVDCFKLRDKTGKTLLEPHFENPASRDAESCYKEGGQSYGEKDLQQVSELRSDDKNMAKDKIAADTQFENAYAREKARRDFAETCFMERRRKEKYY